MKYEGMFLYYLKINNGVLNILNNSDSVRK